MVCLKSRVENLEVSWFDCVVIINGEKTVYKSFGNIFGQGNNSLSMYFGILLICIFLWGVFVRNV